MDYSLFQGELPIVIVQEHEVSSYVMGYHEYHKTWAPFWGEVLQWRMEPDNAVDKYAVAVMNTGAWLQITDWWGPWYKTNLYWHGGNIFYTSMVLYIKTVALKNDASGEITNFQNDIFFKEHCQIWRLSILFSAVLSIIVSVISYSHIWNKNRKCVWQHIRKNVF